MSEEDQKPRRVKMNEATFEAILGLGGLRQKIEGIRNQRVAAGVTSFFSGGLAIAYYEHVWPICFICLIVLAVCAIWFYTLWETSRTIDKDRLRVEEWLAIKTNDGVVRVDEQENYDEGL